jgi:hypothetical protein
LGVEDEPALRMVPALALAALVGIARTTTA